MWCVFVKKRPSNLDLTAFFVCRTLKSKRDAYVSNLNRIYRNNLDKVSVNNYFNCFKVFIPICARLPGCVCHILWQK